MTVYVITEGEYSDYHIVGIYSTRKLAEDTLKLLKAHSGRYYYYNDVEEWDLDTYQPQHTFLQVSYYYDSNEVHSLFVDQPMEFDRYYHSNNDNSRRYNAFMFTIPYNPRLDDELVLRKVAQDRFAAWKAERANI